jgi:hypothetical protein
MELYSNDFTSLIIVIINQLLTLTVIFFYCTQLNKNDHTITPWLDYSVDGNSNTYIPS